MLKVKIKTLAQEKRIIRKEICKAKSGSTLQGQLYHHLQAVVRIENRWSLLAYAFLRGVPLKKLEKNAGKGVNFDKVKAIVERFGLVGASWNAKQKAEQLELFEKWKNHEETPNLTRSTENTPQKG